MATDKPRITVTLQPHVYKTIKALAKLQGVSMSFVVGDLMADFQPILERVGVVLQDANNAPAAARACLLESASMAQSRLEPLLASAIDQLSIFESSSREVLERGASSAADTPCRSSNPRPSNHGGHNSISVDKSGFGGLPKSIADVVKAGPRKAKA